MKLEAGQDPPRGRKCPDLRHKLLRKLREKEVFPHAAYSIEIFLLDSGRVLLLIILIED
jgi:hypothetical protein